MSTERRKIGHYAIEMIDEKDQHCFLPQVFRDFLFNLSNKPRNTRLENAPTENKAILLEGVSETFTVGGLHILNVQFASCKYNHAPDYMSSKSGRIRATSKQKEEGEQELTHFSINLTDEEGYILFEERRSGVSLGRVEKYLTKWFLQYQREENLTPLYKFEISYVPQDDFLQMLKRSEKVCSAELFVDKKILGSDFLEFANISTSIRDELILNISPVRGKPIEKSLITQALSKLNGNTNAIKRIRIRIKDEDGINTVVDTIHGKRKNEVTVELRENGTVNSDSMFGALEEAFTGGSI